MKKVILDTNLILRFLLKDIPAQAKKAERIMTDLEEGTYKGLISILVINELIWILNKYYKIEKNIYFPKIKKLLAINTLQVIEIQKDLLMDILDAALKHNVDFTDAYLFGIKGDDEIITFDEDFKKFNS